MTRLTFSAGGHAYYLADPLTGKKTRVTSVTTLLNLLAKPALVRWAARTAADYAVDHWDDLGAMSLTDRQKQIAAAPDQSRNEKAASGTAIHALAESMLAGRPIDVPPDLLPKVEGLARWWERSGLTLVASERRVWSDEDDDLGLCAFAGTLDILATHPTRGLGLLDIKTGAGVYGDMAVQLAGYMAADQHVVDDKDDPAPVIAWAGILHVRPDGTSLHTADADQLAVAAERFETLRYLKGLAFPTFQMEA
jgi:hypothetical protein